MRQVKGASVGHLLFGLFAGLSVHECEDDQLALGLAVKVAVFVLEELVAYLDLEGYLLHGVHVLFVDAYLVSGLRQLVVIVSSFVVQEHEVFEVLVFVY